MLPSPPISTLGLLPLKGYPHCLPRRVGDTQGGPTLSEEKKRGDVQRGSVGGRSGEGTAFGIEINNKKREKKKEKKYI